ncbi:MAG: hypothetical protein V3V99_02385 [candidate division Zixibacteria bacterium]
MAVKSFETKHIDIADLLLDLQNPRFERQNNQREALKTMVEELGLKLVNIAGHIAQYGPNPSEIPIVIRSKKEGQYIVLEGNRRIVAIKLATDPKLVESLKLPTGITRKLKSINQKYGANLPLSVQCSVAPNRKEADVWVELRHTGENKGIGIIQWSGVATSRFKGELPDIQIVEHVKDSDYLDSETRDKLHKIKISNLQRFIGTPEARKKLGIDIVKKQLIFLNPNEKEKIIGRLAIVISDMVNQHIKVTQIDNKEQRISYANAVAKRSLPILGERITPTQLVSKKISASSSTKKKNTRIIRNQKYLIPPSLNLNITQGRIANIFKELKKLPLDTFENSAAVLLRVFLEMSLNEFAKLNRIRLKVKSTNKDGKEIEKDMTLQQKIVCVVDKLVANDESCKNELHAIRAQTGSRNTIFSITNWQAYVHNQHYNPIASELRTIWDNIQPLFQKIWK